MSLAFALVGCGPSNTYVPPPPPEVSVLTVEPRDVEVFREFSGQLEATQSVDVRARVRGFLEEIHFRAGQIVQAGDPLFTIEQGPYRAALQNAVGALERAKAAEKLSQTKFEMQRQLFEKQAISELEFRQAEAQRDEATAAVKQAEGALDTARLELEYTEITAPITGRVSRELVTVGNLVGSGENTLLTTIVADDPVYAYFTADERMVLGFLRERGGRGGDATPPEVRLRLADGYDYPLPGVIDFADNQVSPQTGTITLRATVPNPDGELVPGVFARVRTPNPRSDALVIPTRAIQRDLSGPFVMLVGDDQTAVSRYVTEGPPIGSETIITDGLAPGDRVIVDGLQRARPGLPVKATPIASGKTETDAEADAESAGPDASGEAGPPDGGSPAETERDAD